jgi:uncharacterized lipoprotein YddW (UPF0748 family)
MFKFSSSLFFSRFLSFFTVLFFCGITACSQSTKTEPIRGTWITNVASNALSSREKIKETVRLCKENGLNHIFVVTWNKGLTLYPSEVLKAKIGIAQDPFFSGRDPIQEIIEEGHAVGLKVHAWFEFGFSYGYKDSTTIWNQRYPQWVGRDVKGNLLQKNGFFWWSAINPEVQNFMIDLINEFVTKYDIDGVQGDDRLPAMPGEGGYDEATLRLYAEQHQGAAPPSNPKDSAWIQWKADQLSLFGKKLYEGVKKIKPSCWVTWAPSIYPWSKEQYLQDWPAWLKGGYADYVIPQLYRYNLKAYENVLKELSSQAPEGMKHKVFPGILTSLGDGYQSSRELTDQMIQLNRKYGFEGEVFFYFETLNRLPGKLYSK